MNNDLGFGHESVSLEKILSCFDPQAKIGPIHYFWKNGNKFEVFVMIACSAFGRRFWAYIKLVSSDSELKIGECLELAFLEFGQWK